LSKLGKEVKMCLKSSKILQEQGRNTKSITQQLFVLTELFCWKQYFRSLYSILQFILLFSFSIVVGRIVLLKKECLSPNSWYLGKWPYLETES
jgi:hypothetical protein